MKLFPLIILFSINIPISSTANALPENLLESSGLVKAGNKYMTLLGR